MGAFGLGVMNDNGQRLRDWVNHNWNNLPSSIS